MNASPYKKLDDLSPAEVVGNYRARRKRVVIAEEDGFTKVRLTSV